MKTKFGYMNCENRKCGKRVVVKVNELQTLSYGCQECGKSAYAKKATQEHTDWLSDIEPSPTVPAPAAEKKPAAAPEKKRIVDSIL